MHTSRREHVAAPRFKSSRPFPRGRSPAHEASRKRPGCPLEHDVSIKPRFHTISRILTQERSAPAECQTSGILVEAPALALSTRGQFVADPIARRPTNPFQPVARRLRMRDLLAHRIGAASACSTGRAPRRGDRQFRRVTNTKTVATQSITRIHGTEKGRPRPDSYFNESIDFV